MFKVGDRVFVRADLTLNISYQVVGGYGTIFKTDGGGYILVLFDGGKTPPRWFLRTDPRLSLFTGLDLILEMAI